MFESKWRGINGNYVMRSNRELFYCYGHQEIVLCNNYVKACGGKWNYSNVCTQSCYKVQYG
ncbi:hypothetical protein D7V94_04530 [Parablautia intestinalis]|uniref:Uncharacterized protein n=1 Tax=Parablautia intestinalis TaxID=2320100 RepID=A0A3A9APB9_9FIRM|nr:hypothetical protein D7V94_04530 [Parablautia intestinalis]